MANKRLAMTIQKEILRLKSLGRSQRKTAKLLGISRETVSKYWQGELPSLESNPPPWTLNIEWGHVLDEINKGVPRKILYEELASCFKLPTYQAFCQFLRRHHGQNEVEVTIKQVRLPGESIEVDYSGDSISILSPSTGEIQKVQLFAGSLSYSGYFFAQFTPTQKLEDFIRSHVDMFTYFGGVASYIVPDNCKTAVLKASKNDPVIHPTYQDMCRHYGISVDPADVRSPRHKPNVENAIKYIQADFLPRIRNKTFTSLMELNKELGKWLELVNSKPIQGRGESRNFFFEKERANLAPLPTHPYELFYFKRAKVHPDCHFQHDKNYYSVPHRFVGKEIEVKFNSRMVHAYYQCEQIASHSTQKGTFHYSTNPEHYPEKKFVDTNIHLAYARKQARLLGGDVFTLVNRLIKESKHPLKILRKVQGILRLSKQLCSQDFNYGCSMALEFDRLNINDIKRFARSRPKKKQSLGAPVRSGQLICLQGGKRD